jgi:hypothetical protein
MNVRLEAERLAKLSNTDLRSRYLEVCGEPTRSGNRPYMVRRILWRMQANVEGGLSERARQRALELAAGADLRLRPPRPPRPPSAPQPDVAAAVAAAFAPRPRGPMPGTLITRRYKGRSVVVKVLEEGFECDGEVFRSLSAVANAITGSHCSGRAFFGLTRGTKP